MIQELNRHIDKIDVQMVVLLAKRMELSHKIGEEKKKPGHETHLRTREIEVLDKVKVIGNSVGLEDRFLADLYQVILDKSRQLETQE